MVLHFSHHMHVPCQGRKYELGRFGGGGIGWFWCEWVWSCRFHDKDLRLMHKLLATPEEPLQV